MTDIDWSKAPEFTIGALVTKKNNVHHPRVSFVLVAGLVGCNIRAISSVDRAALCAPSDCWEFVERPAEWTGEGLPPVGADVECTFAVEMHEIWHRGTVVHCASSPEGDQFVVVDTGEVSACYRVDGTCLRPYRTPEQIAADERLHSVRNACTAIAETLDGLRGKTKVERAALEVVEAMIDAGYRRVEQ